MAVSGGVKLLQRAEVLHVFLKQLLIVLLRFGQCRSGRGPFAQVQLLPWRHVIGLRIDRHGVHLPCKSCLLQIIYPRAWRRGNESVQWLKLSESVPTRIDQESEQLCTRQAEGGAVMSLIKI